MTIRSKLILRYAGLLAILLVAFGVVLFIAVRSALLENADNTLTATTDQIWRNTAAVPVNAYGATTRIQLILPDADYFSASGAAMQVWQLDNNSASPTLITESANIKTAIDAFDVNALSQQQSFNQADKTPTSLYTTVTMGGGEWRVLTLPSDVYGGRVIIQAATPLETVNQASQNLAAIIIVAIASMLIVSTVLYAAYQRNVDRALA